MTNRINPQKLLHSKWTRVHPEGKEKHFLVSKVTMSDSKVVIDCQLEAVMSKQIYHIDWRQLKNEHDWLMGWK